MLNITLTRNQSNPERYTRFILYYNNSKTCSVYGHKSGRLLDLRTQLEWSQIDRTKQRRTGLEGWPEHVAAQEVRELPETPLTTRAGLIAAGLLKPKDATKWRKSLKAVTAAAAGASDK